MPDPSDTMKLKLDPISLQIIRQQMLHSVERLSDEDLEETADETTDADQDTGPILLPTRQTE